MVIKTEVSACSKDHQQHVANMLWTTNNGQKYLYASKTSAFLDVSSRPIMNSNDNTVLYQSQMSQRVTISKLPSDMV